MPSGCQNQSLAQYKAAVGYIGVCEIWYHTEIPALTHSQLWLFVAQSPRKGGPEGVIATGHPGGQVYFWSDRAVVSVLSTYSIPPKVNLLFEGRPEGSAGVRCLRVVQLENWQARNGTSGEQRDEPEDAEDGERLGYGFFCRNLQNLWCYGARALDFTVDDIVVG